MTNNIAKIRAALDICDCGICDEARAALAELERAAAQPAPKFEAPEVDDRMRARVFVRTGGFGKVDEWLSAWRAELGPTLGLVTREELAARVEAAYREGFQRGNVEMPDEDAGEYWLNSNARKQLEAK